MNPDVRLHCSDQMGKDGSGRGGEEGGRYVGSQGWGGGRKSGVRKGGGGVNVSQSSVVGKAAILWKSF